MLTPTALSILALAPGSIAGSSSRSPEVLDEWTVLPTPALCTPRAPAPRPAPLWDGSHLLPGGDRPATAGEGPGPRLPLPTLTRLIEEDAAARGARLEFFKSTSGLLARGDAAALEGARALIADLERADERLWIELDVELAPAAAGNADAAAGFKSKVRVRSGEGAFFGARDSRAFVQSFDVEVAADSGVADPVVGAAVSGRTLHLSACRVDGGRRVHLAGLLDLAELAGVESFDPSTSDLGVVEEPLVDVAQVTFAGVVDSGGSLEVALAGTRLAQPDWKLTVRAASTPDPERGKEGGEGWAVVDLAFLAHDAPEPPAVQPGAGLERLAAWSIPARGGSSVPPSALAAALDARGGDSSMARGGPRRSLVWTDDLLLVPRSDAAALDAARDLARGAEALRLSCNRMEVRAGAFTVRFPTCEGFPARVLSGRERTWLVDYHAEIAPQTWMPAPDVQKAFDGLALEAAPGARSAACSFWIAESGKPLEVKRETARLGRLQLLSRRLRGDSTVLGAGEPERRFLEGAPVAADGAGAPGATGAPAALALRFVRP